MCSEKSSILSEHSWGHQSVTINTWKVISIKEGSSRKMLQIALGYHLNLIHICAHYVAWEVSSSAYYDEYITKCIYSAKPKDSLKASSTATSVTESWKQT